MTIPHIFSSKSFIFTALRFLMKWLSFKTQFKIESWMKKPWPENRK
jgi:hypothetical protein